jgi:hypothetical protein
VVLSDTLAPAAFDGQQMQAACRRKSPRKCPLSRTKITDRSRRSLSTASATTISLFSNRAGNREASLMRKPNRAGNHLDSGEKSAAAALGADELHHPCQADARAPTQSLDQAHKKSRSRPLTTTQGGAAAIGLYERGQPPPRVFLIAMWILSRIALS